MAEPFERALQQIAENTSVMAEQMPIITESVKKIYRVENEEKEKDQKKATKKEREEADVSGGKGEDQDTLKEIGGLASSLTAIRKLLKENLDRQSGDSEGGGSDWFSKFFNRNKKQEGGFIYKSPIQKFQNGGGVYTVPGNSTGDNHPMLLPTGSFVLNRNASQYLEARQTGGSISEVPHGFESGGMVPTVVESGEKIFGPGNWDGLLPILNSVMPRFGGGFQAGGKVEKSKIIPVAHSNTGSGYGIGGVQDYKGRPAVFSQGAADAFAKMLSDSKGVVNGTDIYSSQRSASYNASLQGASPTSNHLSGNAMDIHGASKSWIKKNGSKYGWHNLVYSGHDGHFDYKGAPNVGQEDEINIPENKKDRVEITGDSKSPPQPKSLQEIIQPSEQKSAGGPPQSLQEIIQPSEQKSDGESNIFGSIFETLASIFNFKSIDVASLLGLTSIFSGGSDKDSSDSSSTTNQESNIIGGLSGLTSIFSGGSDKDSSGSSSTTNQESNISSGGGSGDVAKSNEPYDIAKTIGFSKADWDIYRNSVGNIESGNKYNIAGGSGGHYDGRWQLGSDAKQDAAGFLGEKYAGHGDSARKAFQQNPDMQEKYFAAFTAKNHSYLTGHPKYDKLSTRQKFEILGYAHNQGAGGASTWLDTGKVGEDGFGTKADKYSKALRQAYKNQPDKKQSGGIISPFGGTKDMQPVKVESGEKIFPPGSYGTEVKMLNDFVPRFQTGGSVGSTNNNSSITNNKFSTVVPQFQTGGSVGSTNTIIPQYQTGGPVNVKRSINQIHNVFQQANKTKMDSDTSSNQPIIIPIPQPTGGGGGGQVNDDTSGSHTPSLPNEPSNHIVSTLMMQTYALMNRIG